jgi:hypothetical protein
MLGTLGMAGDPGGGALAVEPREARLVGSDSFVQLLVTAEGAGGRPADLTAEANYECRDATVAEVGPDGLIRPRGDGRTEVVVTAGGRRTTVPVVVDDVADTRPVRFVGDVVPIFSKLGCNNGGCHGKASGQNGFKLSLLGFDPRFDYEALAKEARGRRLFPARPEQSLLLLKSTAKVPHAGGRKIAPGSPEYNTIRRWIAQGAPFDPDHEAKLVKIAVSPASRVVPRRAAQQLRVEATYDDGRVVDVTRLAQYQSNAADLADVDDRGRVRALDGVGVAAIMARFGGQVAVARATIPLGKDVPNWEMPASSNRIDPLVFGKLRELGLPPSPPCTDAEFARRSALDICGILPSPDEVRAFEASADPDKRDRWVDGLLNRPEYADFFAMKWSSILRNKKIPFGGPQGDAGTFAFHAWIRQAMAENMPYDRFAAEILTARGDVGQHPAVVWYREFNRTTENMVEDTAQLFLGLRIQCAKCHHHPFEKWSQDDYYGYTAFFTRVGRKPGSSDPFSARVYTLPSGLAKNETTKKEYKPKALDGPEYGDLGPRDDPRDALAAWLRRPETPFLARTVVNRYWKHFFGRGLVDPEDDMRVSNPPSNPELLDALVADFIKSGYDLKHLVRTIATSQAYGLSSLPNEYNAGDRQNFARYYSRRLPAEVLLDALDAVTGSTETYPGLPKGFRAVQLPDDGGNGFFGGEEQGPFYFLRVFGRPKRESVCECERSAEANLSQTLHLLNSPEIQQKLATGSGRAAKWAADEKAPDNDKVAALYRLAFSRDPSPEELSVCLAHLARRRSEKKAAQGFEDLVWALINSKEFLFNH